ncbi:hypothetical protein COU77_02320 [Candidatus Peregrinibacteria bacterium CG10_big_fil_rev_8_21_14_0_10_49_16]|nr:MAG: hypothetical protein COW95_01885 [Candidatus Peregrinibacteria bacterium CG22_combo_CG10-13_8_21_14_all_49_11]PIR52080.1 MAG: hypothetical protein COU77_02320 [Candidatus Peregrinibacteria bacterium CG10_big_fil_rev_8_21_14_0_10_49_16]
MAIESLSEEELQQCVLQAQDGDTDAFEELYNVFFPQVYRYAAFRLPRDLAEDTVADIFVKAWEKLHTYTSKKNIPFSAWLFRIARHTVIDVYRAQRGFEEVSENLVDTDKFNTPEGRFAEQEAVHIVREALDQLPRRYREVLVLSFIADLSHKEVATVLHMTEGGVRVLKLRALRKLEAQLSPQFQFST